MNLPRVDPSTLISTRARHEWENWKRLFDNAAHPTQDMTPAHSETDMQNSLNNRQDTVGAVAWDAQNRLAAGVSRCNFFTTRKTYDELD